MYRHDSTPGWRLSTPQIPPAPAGDRGLDVLEVPLQGALALGAAPTAVVLAGREHPPQPNLAQGFAAHAQLGAGLGGADPDPLTAGFCRGVWAVHQLSSCTRTSNPLGLPARDGPGQPAAQ